MLPFCVNEGARRPEVLSYKPRSPRLCYSDFPHRVRHISVWNKGLGVCCNLELVSERFSCLVEQNQQDPAMWVESFQNRGVSGDAS